MTRSILIACSQHWTSPFQVGSHHLARAYAGMGWRVGFISNPISPFHLLSPNPALWERFAIHRAGGIRDAQSAIWAYVPGALISPANRPLLRSGFVHNSWSSWSIPPLKKVLRRNQFDDVDVLYLDHPLHHRLLQQVRHRASVYRIADFMSGFSHVARPMIDLEGKLAKAVDLVIYPSGVMRDTIVGYQPKRHLHLPNAVDFKFFSEGDRSNPPEYRDITGPICVYVGAIGDLFDEQLVAAAARALPSITFVIIGPVLKGSPAVKALSPLSNVRLLGPRSHGSLPGYLYNANVGIMPLAARRPAGVFATLNPLKMYEYFACGLPCVSTTWAEIERIAPPATLTTDAPSFIAAIEATLNKPPKPDDLIAFARDRDWNTIQRRLQSALDGTD